MAPSSPAPMITAPTAAMVISISIVNGAPPERHDGAPADRHEADQHGGKKCPRCD